MTIDSLQTLVVGLLAAAGTGIGIIGRWASAGARALRLNRSRLDEAEAYIFEQRRHMRAHGLEPLPWPERLGYLSSTTEPEGGKADDPQ